MPRGKARYNAGATFAERVTTGGTIELRDFSADLKRKLRNMYPDKSTAEDPVWGHPADTFVQEILAAARWALPQLAKIRTTLTKAEIVAERDDLLRTLVKVQNALCTLPLAQNKLRKLSPDFAQWFLADPLECADSLDVLIAQSKSVEAALNTLITTVKSAKPPSMLTVRKLKPRDSQHAVAVEMAVRVLRVAKNRGLPIAATAASKTSRGSRAVKLLKLIGDDIGLILAELTWRDIIICAGKRLRN